MPSDERSTQGEVEQGSGRAVLGVLGAVGLVACLPLVALALSLMTGIGLQRSVPGPLAFLAASAVVILPALGLAAALGGRAIAYGLSLAVIAAAGIALAPYYFPKERDAASEIGVRYFTSGFAPSAREASVGLMRDVLGWFGAERQPVPRAERVASDSTPEPRSQKEEKSSADPDRDDRATWIPYEGDGQTIVIPAHVDGPDFGEELKFVFDTGATLTTISADMLALLDVPIPEDAPEVLLRTANGEMQARLVLVDAIWLEREVVEWVTVAVCEHCASEHADGLLGLNVSSHFRVSIDHEAGELEWLPRRGRRNRRLDIQPWLELNSVLRRWDDGRLEVEMHVSNRAPRAIKRSVFEVRCSSEPFAVHLDPIPAGGSVTQMTSLPWGTHCESFEVAPIAATWETDRF